MDKLSCFVACAFDKKDVDEIYSIAIEQVIIELGMKPYRVDRIEHNEDIDDKIIELIKFCDVCIADLTYARPSVYFEAGFFQGLNKAVVFTARNDHFTAREDDVHGNYRIHFDLQMKNIISWSSTINDKTFATRLKKRLQLVTKPIHRLKDQKEEQKTREKIFNAMPLNERLSSLHKMINIKMVQWEWKEGSYSTKGFFIPKDYLSFSKNNKLISFFVMNAATINNLQFVYSNRIIEQHKSLLFNQCHIIIISLRKMPKSRIDDRYPGLELLDEYTKTYRGSVSNGYIRSQPRIKEKEIESYFHFISDIKSLPSFEQALDSVMGKINNL